MWTGGLNRSVPILVWADRYSARSILPFSSGSQPSEIDVYLERNMVPVGGVVRDYVTNEPLTGATVVLDGDSEVGTVIVATDSQGMFEAEVALDPPEPRPLSVSKDGYTTESTYFLAAPRASISPETLDGNFHQIYLERTHAAISGRVLSLETGGPVSGATLSFDDGTVITGTGGDGSYTASLSMGYQSVQVSAPGYETILGGTYVSQRSTGRDYYVTPEGYTPSSSEGPVTITVRDSATGEPIEGCAVWLPGENAKYSDAQGALVQTIPGGARRMTVSKSGYVGLDYSPWVYGFPGWATSVDVYLRSSETPVTFKVQDLATGQPLENAAVWLPHESTKHTNAQGEIVQSLADGNHRLAINRSGYATMDFDPWIPAFPGRPTQVNVYMRSTETPVTIIVKDQATGQAIEGASTWLPGESTKYTAEDGKIIQSLMGGNHRLSVGKSGYRSLDIDPWLPAFPGRSTEHTVYLRATETPVTIMIMDATTGEPLQEASTWLPGESTKYTTEDGWIVQSLTGGNHRLSVGKSGYRNLDISPWLPVYPGRPSTFPVYLESVETPVTLAIRDLSTDKPIEGASTWLPNESTKYTNADGEVVQSLTGGNHRMIVCMGGYHCLDFTPWVSVYPSRDLVIPV
jgi:hypothetical protein